MTPHSHDVKADPRRNVLPWVARYLLVALLALTGITGCASGDERSRDSLGAAASSRPSAAPTATAARSGTPAAARWETVATFSGSSDLQTEAFMILPDAIQWRVRFTCEGDSPFQLTTTPGPRRPGPIAEGACPGEEAFAIHTGQIRLGVQATTAWTAIVDQQVDTALDEPPLDVMASAVVESEGGFYDLDMTGAGTARLYRSPDGRRFLRLENFTTSTNTDLFVWLTDAPHPEDSAAAFTARRFVLGNLKSTVGNQNYEVPPDVGLDARSVVIWCAPVAIAYTAATLEGSA